MCDFFTMLKKLKHGVCFFIAIFSYLLTSTSIASEAVMIRITKDFYSAVAAGDMDRSMLLLSPDVVWVFYGPEDVIDYAGTFKGHEGVRQFFTDAYKTVDISEFTRNSFAVDGNVVIVTGWEKGVSKMTGGEYSVNWSHLFTIENNLITRFEEITDSAAIMEAILPADIERGRAYYATCAACHGVEGEGNPNMHAPRLTLQGSDYLLRQLRNFRQLVRAGVNDFYGWQMNGRAMALPSDRAIRDVLAYIDTFPDIYATDSTGGNSEDGKRLYNTYCISCHGEKAEGILTLNAPALAGLDGWYHLEQLRKFKDGTRGSHEADMPGQQMRAAMTPVEDEKAMIDIIEYINSIE